MTRQPDSDVRPAPRPDAGRDDAALGRLVRAAADTWAMPPVRLDAPGWRERVRVRRTSGGTARERLGRLGRAATAAVAMTVVAAIFGVWLTQQPPGIGKPSTPAGTATPGSTAATAASPLPKLLVSGDLPRPSAVIVELEDGDHAIADLATGTLGPRLTGSGWPSQLRQLADGSLACVCATPSGNVAGSPTKITMTLVRYDATGSVLSRTDIRTFEGAPDPRADAGAERPDHVLVAVAFARDGRHAFIGWSVRAHPAWRSGILAIDLTDGSVTGEATLPDASTGEGDARRVVDAPRVVGEAGSGLIVARGWYSWSPATSREPAYHFGTDVYTGTFEPALRPGALGTMAALDAGANCGDVIDLAGRLPDGATWLACRQGGGTKVIRRIEASGSFAGDTRIQGGPSDIDGITSVASGDGSSLFAWDPVGLRLTRIDLATGVSTESPAAASVPSGDGGPLGALGRWLTPSAMAKLFLRSGVLASPDGSRIYAIGVRGGGSDEMSGSAGVYAYDAATLALLWHAEPAADYVSLAVSPDGAFLYAAGMPGVDGAGRRSSQPASITVLDAPDGTTRLIAGQLGGGVITFTTSPLP